MGLCTPCAGTRPGAADPTAQQSCVPATAPRTKVTKFLSLGAPGGIRERSRRGPGGDFSRFLVVFRRFWRS